MGERFLTTGHTIKKLEPNEAKQWSNLVKQRPDATWFKVSIKKCDGRVFGFREAYLDPQLKEPVHILWLFFYAPHAHATKKTTKFHTAKMWEEWLAHQSTHAVMPVSPQLSW